MGQLDLAEKTIGVLALQGDFHAHRAMLEDRLGLRTIEVRTAAELDRADALVLPGGESTTVAKLLARVALAEPISARARQGMPIYGTCAGMILLANEIAELPDQPTLGLLDITVARNAFGRQIDSFESNLEFRDETGPHDVRGVFIRAPYVTRSGPEVKVIAELENKIVGVRQANILATAFHPELTDDPGVHKAFARMVANSREKRG